jgi:hypothetical protein
VFSARPVKSASKDGATASKSQFRADWAPSLELENMDQKETETTEEDPHKSSTTTSLSTT